MSCLSQMAVLSLRPAALPGVAPGLRGPYPGEFVARGHGFSGVWDPEAGYDPCHVPVSRMGRFGGPRFRALTLSPVVGTAG